MSAYIIIEFTVKDPDVVREKYSAPLGRRPKSTEPRFSPTVTGRSCTAMARSLQQLIDIRSVAMDARFSLLDGLPTPTEDKRESE